MNFSQISVTKAGAMNVKDRAGRGLATLLAAGVIAGAVLSGGTSARADETYKLSLKDHKFTPPELTVAANERFLIEIENLDATPAEFESSELKVEKFVVGGGKITVRIRALAPGTYKFFDDYNPDSAKGTIVAAEKPKP